MSSQPIRKQLEIASRGRMKIFDGSMVADLTKLGFSMEELYRFVAPRRTLSRRIANGEPLTLQENDSALRVMRVMELAGKVFGETERAQRWLRKPNRALGDIVPLDLLESESGAILIEQALHEIDHGIYA
ncbi:type II RES/Xre toxin-antitoxin system antitoxin [Neorhizobium sp. NPDC001467]|uniref:type II RES/Xre toxin-antitoxin system antitoxin n=1 Tax=Neorhizobium sp. NPDC001467 TaxID=3390595 RepID=UPI003D051BD1